MVRLAGIEPTTPWFVAKYSIQLSYSRFGKNAILAYAFGYDLRIKESTLWNYTFNKNMS